MAGMHRYDAEYKREALKLWQSSAAVRPRWQRSSGSVHRCSTAAHPFRTAVERYARIA